MIYDAPCSLPGASFAHLPGLEDVGFVPRGEAPAQIPGAKISVCHGAGGVSPPPAPSSCRTRHLRAEQSETVCSAPTRTCRYATAAAAPHGLSEVTPPARPATAALKSAQALVPPVSAV